MKRHLILVVEDCEPDVYLIREAISATKIDFQLLVVDDGLKAMQLFDAADASDGAPCPELILLDLNLPKKNGEEVLRHLRKSSACRNARVVIMSSAEAPRDQETLVLAERYFRKPSDYDEFLKLGAVVKELLDGQATPN